MGRSEPLAFEAIFAKATTMVDGGWRISFDCSEQAAVAELSKLRNKGLYLVVMTEEQRNQEAEVYERP